MRILFLAACLAACTVAPATSSKAGSIRPTVTERTRLQSLAESACLCARKSGDKGACWSDFKAAIKPYGEPRGMGSACAPLSSEQYCFNTESEDEDARFCIPIGYSVVSTDMVLCTKAEARTAEAADPTGEHRELVIAAAQAMIEGKAPPRSDAPSNGCAG